MVICKICKKEMASLHIAPAGRKIVPNCICGKIRQHERLMGCPNCSAHGVEIQIKKKWYGWLLYCICKTKWRVWK